MFKKVLLLGAMLASLSLSVASTQIDVKSFDSIKFVVESALDKTSDMVLDNEPVNSVTYYVAIESFAIDRQVIVTGENTQLTDTVIDEAIELAYHETNLATAHLVPQEVGWQI